MSLFAEIESLTRMGVWGWDITANVLRWSEELCRIIDVPAEATPTFELWLARVHPSDLSTVKSHFTHAHRERGDHEIEYRVVRADGSTRTLSSRLRSSATENGIHVVGAERDITECKEVAARIVFSDRMVSIGTLAGGVAHEINNPLATIAANLILLEKSYETSLIEESRKAVERIRTIVRGLTAFSRTNEDRREAIDLRRVLELAIRLTSSEIRHRAKLVTRFGPAPWVAGNEAQLGQVFINLLVNAAEAIDEGKANGNEIRVSLSTDEAGWAVVEISDTGRGIPRDVQARIFDPFFTTKPVGQGTGLGLSISHGIVRSLGGDITFRTDRHKGSTFIVALPPGSTQVARDPSPIPVESPDSRRRSILIVDDELLFATSMRRLLAVEHDVRVTTSGREALTWLTAGERFDVILCDVMMPELTGPELHTAILALDPEQARRMIFITGGAFSPASQAFLERITNPHFEKPCDLGKLRAAIRALADS